MPYNILAINNVLANKYHFKLGNTFYEVLALIFLCLVLFAYLQVSPTILDPDTIYHAKMTLLLKEGNLPQSFPWAYFTVLKNVYTDHHFLFHLLLIPFVVFFEPLIGIKIAGVIFAILAILVFYFVLKCLKVRYAFFYPLFLLATGPLIYRINLGKAPPLSIIFLLLIFLAVVKKKYIMLGILSFLYVWAHGMWPLAICIVFIYLFATWINNISAINSEYQPKYIKTLTSLFAGLTAGLIFNPYFPQNFIFYRYLFEIGIVPYNKSLAVGTEWTAYSFSDLISANGVILILLIIALVFLFIKTVEDHRTYYTSQTSENENIILLTLFLITIFFLFLTLNSRRYIEYFAPFAVLFSAYILNIAGYYPLHIFITWFKSWHNTKRIFCLFISWLIIAGLITSIVQNIVMRKLSFESGTNMYHGRNLALWLKNNTPKKSIIFNSNFGEMPYLFYWNHDNYYIVGLDPVFMYQYDQRLHQKWQDIVDGKIKDNLDKIIKTDFQSHYVVVLGEYAKEFEKNITNNKNFDLIYHDDSGRIYKISRFTNRL